MVAVIAARRLGQQPLVEVDAALDGAIADRMDTDLERGGVRRAHAREELIHAERLCHVVVGSDIEGSYFVGLVLAHR